MKKLLFLLIAITACTFYTPTINTANIKERAKLFEKNIPSQAKPTQIIQKKPATTQSIPPAPTKQAPKPTVKTGTKPSTPIIPPAPTKHAPIPPIKKAPETEIVEERWTKVYGGYEGNSNVLDICIILNLNNTEYDTDTPGATIPWDGSFDQDDAVVIAFQSCIKSEEATIVSSQLFTSILQNEHYIKRLHERGWSIFTTKDRQYVLIIPHDKYPKIEKIENLKTIGLDPSKLDKVMYYSEKIALDKYKAKIKNFCDEILQKTYSGQYSDHKTLNTDYLFNLFMKVKNLDIRAVLFGHGLSLYDEYGMIIQQIAQLINEQFRTLRDVLNNAACSFLYIISCYGGQTVYKAQTLNIKRTKYEKNLNKKLSSKNFIEVAEGIPGFEIYAKSTKIGYRSSDLNFSGFFRNINKFFLEEKISILNLLESKFPDQTNLGQVINNISEQEILSGTKIKLTTKDNKNIYYNLPPILERKKDIIQSIQFVAIFENFTPTNIVNLPRVRFPGDSHMKPLTSGSFADIKSKAINLITIKIANKSKQLETIKAFKPGPILEGAHKTVVNELEIEISDMKEYLNDLKS